MVIAFVVSTHCHSFVRATISEAAAIIREVTPYAYRDPC
jgi:hypothetical protein